MGLTVLAVLVEGEDIVDIVDEGGDGDSAYGDWRGGGEIFLVFFNEKVSVVEEEAVELGQVLLLCHCSFIADVNPSIMLTKSGMENR